MRKILTDITLYILAASLGMGIAQIQKNDNIINLTNEEENAIIYNINKEQIQKDMRFLWREDLLEPVFYSIEEVMPDYDIPLDKELQQFTYEKCKEYGVDYNLVIAIMKTESNFKVDLIYKNKNGSRDQGIMQINTIHKENYTKLGFTDMLDPYQNIEYGIILLSDISSSFDDEHLILLNYNMGTRGARKVMNRGITSSKYSRKVVEYKEELTKEGDGV